MVPIRAALEKFIAQHHPRHPRRQFDHIEIENASGMNAKLAMQRKNPLDTRATFARLRQRHQRHVFRVAHNVAREQKMSHNCFGIERFERAAIGIQKFQHVRFCITRGHVDLFLFCFCSKY